MAEARVEKQRGWAARSAVIGFFATAFAFAGYLLYQQSTRLLICYETNAALPDEAYVDIMIRDIVKNGDHGGRAYANKLEYLGDRTECCTIERVTDRLPSGVPGKPEVSVSARYFNTTRQDYVPIQRRFDACGHPASKPLIAG